MQTLEITNLLSARFIYDVTVVIIIITAIKELNLKILLHRKEMNIIFLNSYKSTHSVIVLLVL